MSLFKFTKAMLNNQPLELYNKGNHYRDFTYIDDVIDGIIKIIKKPFKKKIGIVKKCNRILVLPIGECTI